MLLHLFKRWFEPPAQRTKFRQIVGRFCLISGLGLPCVAKAQVLINESFRNATSSAFTLRNNAVLTANSASGVGDTDGNGYLRLTGNTTSQRGAVISNDAFSAAQGFNISFELFAYANATGGADGFSVFLIDGSTSVANFTPGAFGSSLGYAPATTGTSPNTTTTPGATNGYIGIGLDEYGGFNTSNEGRTGGGTAFVRNTIAVRGNAASSYALLTPTLTASNTGSALGVATTRAQSGSTDYRRATINVTPTGGTFRITVRVQNGTGVVTAVNSFLLNTPPPPTLRLGLAASTGGFTNTHEIRNLYVVVPPTAADDNAVTPNNTPITLNILGNDNPASSSFDYNTIDLNPSTIAIDRTVTVTASNGSTGTFAVNTTTGTVTFTPTNTSSVGSFSVPYVVSTVATTGTNAVPATPTNPATITVQVGGSGADIATSISGPATVQPGTSISYTITTTNVGTTNASTVVPRLTLDQNLTLTSPLPTGANYTNGVLTFPTTGTLAANGSVTYTVTFTAPASTSTVAATASATTTSTDVNAANNNGTAANSRTNTDVSRPLGVQLVHFQARAAGSAVQVVWQTASEENNAYFVVERSTDGTNFVPLAQLEGQGTSAREMSYSYQDQPAVPAVPTTLYYRLRQVDTDGTATLSPIQAVAWAPQLGAPVLHTYPNPMHGQLTVDLTNWPVAPCLVELVDLAGRSHYRQVLTGGEVQQLAVPALATGTYVLRVQGPGRQQAKLVVQQ
ncbi:T9SS type A sorting domain-containing protein [Hymenobacter sp. BT559]|uniref:T9SS type A sorting domain-containing protein n=1 Tax=Hymenobacter sp. BT559 TaxID=2795729 RepID=UPI0018EE3F4B|nr:T9SS type A sorting domain-containing protein [Hymenobacter sp. BT559]MBJ6144821.1 T9SS type A sorting domain-containing protein [Hymenobacter sp. BT559]